MNGAAIRILLVDDHAIVREGYRALLAKQPDMLLVAEAGDAATAYGLFRDVAPDVVVTDWSLPGQSGLELIGRIRQRDARAKILVFSMHQNPAFAWQACRAGALGYIGKNEDPETLLQAIRDVRRGRHVLSGTVAQALAMEKLGGEGWALEALTPREFEILRLLVAARTPAQIAKLLNISVKTVCNSHYLIKRKLGVGSDIELTRLAIKLNVVDLLELTDPNEPERDT